MSDAKFLGLCILLASGIISGTIVWSTTVTHAAPEPPSKEIPLSVTAPATTTTATTVTIQGPVTLAPFTAPIPVTITTTPDAPVNVKEVTEKKWTR